jgi:hypothetical protein
MSEKIKYNDKVKVVGESFYQNQTGTVIGIYYMGLFPTRSVLQVLLDNGVSDYRLKDFKEKDLQVIK